MEHDGSYGSGRFCSIKCSRGFSTKAKRKEINEKISKKLKKNPKYIISCLNCGNNIKTHNKKRKYCSTICQSSHLPKQTWYKELMSAASKKAGCGGYRRGSGRGKGGWYKGIYCDSTWELAWIIYSLDHNVKFQRNKQSFEYFFEGKYLKYYPDFIIHKEHKEYVEIKGYETNQNKAKQNQFPHKLTVLYQKDLKEIFEYVKTKYGQHFIELYENNPHKIKNNFCGICGNPCINLYCSRNC